MSSWQSQARRRGWEDRPAVSRGFLQMSSRASEDSLPSVATASTPLSRRVVSATDLTSAVPSSKPPRIPSGAPKVAFGNKTKQTSPAATFWSSAVATRSDLPNHRGSIKPKKPRSIYRNVRGIFATLCITAVVVIYFTWAKLQIDWDDYSEPVEEGWDEEIDYLPQNDDRKLHDTQQDEKTKTTNSAQERRRLASIEPFVFGAEWSFEQLRARRLASCTDIEARRRRMTLVAVCREKTQIPLPSLASYQGALRDEDELLFVSWQATSSSGEGLGPTALSSAIKLASGSTVAILNCETQIPGLFFSKYEANSTVSWSTGQLNAFDQLVTEDATIATRDVLMDLLSGTRDMQAQVIAQDDLKISVESDTRTTNESLMIQVREYSMRRMIPWTEKFSFLHEGDQIHIQGSIAPSGKEMSVSWSDRWSFEYDHHTFSASPLGVPSVLKTCIVKATELSEMDRRMVVSRSIDLTLHDGYAVPWAVLNQLDVNHWELFREVQSQKSSGVGWGRPRGLVFADLGGTAAQRILALSSVLAVGTKFERSVVVSWQFPLGTSKSEQRYPDLFKREFVRSRIIPLRTWSCTKGPKQCVPEDTSYSRFLQHRSIHTDNEDIVRKVLVGGVNWKTHIVIKLESPLGMIVSDVEKAQAVSSLKPSAAMRTRMSHFGDVTSSLGVYIGERLSRKSVDALAERLRAQARRTSKAKYFLGGSDRSKVAILQSRLGNLSVTPQDAPERGKMNVGERIIEEVAELFALGTHCRDIIRDGNCPEDVLDLIQLFGLARRQDWARSRGGGQLTNN